MMLQRRNFDKMLDFMTNIIYTFVVGNIIKDLRNFLV